jgi:hypothetical protein
MNRPLRPGGFGFQDGCYKGSPTTANPLDDGGWFTITHPFHPLCGVRYELIDRSTSWNFDRVFYFDSHGIQRSLSTNLTDVLPADPFVVASQGRSAFRVSDLLELRSLLDRRLAQDKENDHL